MPRRFSISRELPWLLLGVFLVVGGAMGQGTGDPMAAPPSGVLDEARAIVTAMKASDRGPYKRLRWFCKDGTVHPPRPYPCADRGGGNQHAEYSDARERLAALGWHVGTILTGSTLVDLRDAENRNDRLRELPIERYLTDTQEGWVLAKARFYRGSVQAEDEEEAGRAILTRLLAGTEDVSGDGFLLARELVRALPHQGAGDRVRQVRRLATEVAEKAPSFETLRIKIHTRPDDGDVRRVETWITSARASGESDEAVALAAQLRDALQSLHGAGTRAERLARAARNASRTETGRQVAALLQGVMDLSASERLARLAQVLEEVRRTVSTSGDGPANLALMDLSLDAEAELLAAAGETLDVDALQRRRLVVLLGPLVNASWGVGLLSDGERAALSEALNDLAGSDRVDAEVYLRRARRLERASEWAYGSVRWTFGRPLVRYAALEPKAARFPDDLLRGSPLLPLAEAAGALSRDAEARAGLSRNLFGREGDGVAGLNPGVARGRLRILAEDDLSAGRLPAPSEVVFLPRTVSELPPVAGILTRDEGNPLSHVQILARNLGLPNAILGPAAAPLLEGHEGREVLFVVGTEGSVFLGEAASLPASVRVPGEGPPDTAGKVDAPRPDLEVRRPLPLEELSAPLSGRVVGPKAANVGELARLFPGQVAPSIALPFGMYAEHAGTGPGSPHDRIARAWEARLRGDLDEAGLRDEIESVRERISTLRLSAAAREELVALMEQRFGPPGTYGVFVRSDTNVEDLPGFTGAGLNTTIPNVVGLEAQLQAIPRVWASPFRPRAFAWRARALRDPSEVYPSVLLMKSVPCDKSGVLVTADLATGGEGLTVAVAWGVGGAVDGESAETLVLRPDGSTTIVSEAKAPYRRALSPEGGIEWVPAPMGPVLSPGEREEVRDLAAQIRRRMTPVRGEGDGTIPWDVEFGFEGGRLVLFQVRPFVERGREVADSLLRALGVRVSPAGGTVWMEGRLGMRGLPTPAGPTPQEAGGGGGR